MMPVLDGYVHCKRCIVDSGDEPYIQNIEVGVKDNTDLYVNCKTHGAVITKFIIQPVDTGCDCCE